MARPYWSGQIQISLVTFGVKLFVATEAKSEIRFHQISRKTGERVKYQKISASAAEQQEATGEDTPASARVEKDEIVKGYEYRKGQYVTIEPEEIAHLRVPSKHTISIEQFVKLDEVPPEYLEKPYFVTPENDTQVEAFATVREALRKSNKAALGKIAFGGREHVLALTADEDDAMRGMMAYTMRYQEELRDPKEYFTDIKKVDVAADSLELAMELVKRKSTKFDPSKFSDAYESALRELVEAKVNNAPIPQEEPVAPTRGKVVNLMDALRKSVAGNAAAGASAEAAAAGASSRAAAKQAEKHGTASARTAAKAAGISLVKGEPKPPAKATGSRTGAKSSGKRRSA